MNQVKDIIVAVDNQNRLTYLNKAAVRQYGIDKEESLGLKLTQLYKQLWYNPEEEQKAVLSLKDRGYWEGINVQLQPDGTKKVVETVVNSIKDETGKEVGLLSISRDITSRVNVDDWLLESNQRLKYVVETSGMMVYEIEDDTKEVVIVRGLEELLGYSVGEVSSTVDWWISQIHPEDRSRAQEQFYPTKPVDKVVNEYRIKSKNGDYIFVQGVAKVLLDKAGKALKIIGSMQDITDRKKAEEALKEKNQQLAITKKKLEETVVRTEEYANQMEELANARAKQLQEQERMVAIGQTAGMVGHDIRNPLQAITGDVYLLRDYLSGMPDKISVKHDVVESLEEIEKNIGYINKIVADLQDYSKAINPELRDVNLYDLVISAFRPIEIPENVNPSLEIDRKINLKTDPTLFTRILTNLVINALQAMPKGGDLSIAATKKQDTVVFSVADTGVGIPEDVKPKLFTPMMTTKAKGQGLGLAVVKRLVEALKGTISFESQEGKGTTFTVALPINQAK